MASNRFPETNMVRGLIALLVVLAGNAFAERIADIRNTKHNLSVSGPGPVGSEQPTSSGPSVRAKRRTRADMVGPILRGMFPAWGSGEAQGAPQHEARRGPAQIRPSAAARLG